MSYDYGTKHFKGYHHDDGVVIYMRNRDGDERLGYLDPELVSELQSIVDQWKSCMKYEQQRQADDS